MVRAGTLRRLWAANRWIRPLGYELQKIDRVPSGSNLEGASESGLGPLPILGLSCNFTVPPFRQIDQRKVAAVSPCKIFTCGCCAHRKAETPIFIVAISGKSLRIQPCLYRRGRTIRCTIREGGTGLQGKQILVWTVMAAEGMRVGPEALGQRFTREPNEPDKLVGKTNPSIVLQPETTAGADKRGAITEIELQLTSNPV